MFNSYRWNGYMSQNIENNKTGTVYWKIRSYKKTGINPFFLFSFNRVKISSEKKLDDPSGYTS